MKKKKLSYSIRKHIRREKAHIRAQFSDAKEAEEKIREFIAKVMGGLTSSER